MKMTKYRFEYSYIVYTSQEIEAETLHEAEEKLDKHFDEDPEDKRMAIMGDVRYIEEFNDLEKRYVKVREID